MTRTVGTILLLASLACAGSAQTIDQSKLRDAIKLPQLAIEFDIHFSSRNASDDPNASMTTLQQSLRGSASDAPIYMKIGDLYNSDPLNDVPRAKAAYRRAIPLFRKQIERQPRDGWAMSQLGTGLWESDENAEAEKLLRKAVLIAPNDWRVWAELGKFVQKQSLAALGIGKLKPVDFSEEGIAVLRRELEAALSTTARPDRIAQMQKNILEAQGNFDRAVSLNPNSPEPYEVRAGSFWPSQMILQSVIDTAQGKKSDASQGLPIEMLNDMWKAADLVPGDPSRQGMAAYFDIMRLAASAEFKMGMEAPGCIDRMPPASRVNVHTAIARLGKIAEEKDPRNSMKAASALTILHFFNGDMPQMEKWTKRLLSMDPNNKSAWAALSAAYLSTKRYDEFAVAEKDHLKHEDTSYNRLVLAKIYDSLHKPTLASEQVSSSIKRFPNDLLLNLASVDLLLRRPDNAALKQAGDPMAHAESLFAKMSLEDQKSNRANMNLTRGIYLARIGKVAVAKQVLQTVLVDDAENEQARDIIGILGGSR